MTDNARQRGSKPASASRTTQVHIVMPMHVNAAQHLFGGILMEWIDVVAAVAAKRHAQREVLTAAVDHLSFLAPANLGDTVELVARITYVGTTSMEVCVESYVEYTGTKREKPLLVNRAYLTMVALDEANRPAAGPLLRLKTEREKADFEAGRKRREERKRLKL